MILRPSVICFRGFLSALFQQFFIFLTTLYTMLVLDFRLTALVLLFPLDFPFGNLYRKKSVKIIEKPEVSCQISIVSWQRISRESGLSRPSIKRIACKQNLMKSTKNTWSMPTVLWPWMPSFLRPAMSLLKLLGYAVLMAYFGYRGLYLGITAGTMYALSSINRLFDPLIEVTQNFQPFKLLWSQLDVSLP